MGIYWNKYKNMIMYIYGCATKSFMGRGEPSATICVTYGISDDILDFTSFSLIQNEMSKQDISFLMQQFILPAFAFINSIF